MSRSMPRLASCLLALVIPLVAWSGRASAQTLPTPAPGPRDYHEETHPHRGLLIAGGVVFGAAYGAALTAAVTDTQCSNNAWLVLPVAGPFITAARYNKNYEGVCNDSDTIKAAMSSMDGVVQTVGAVLILSSLIFPTHQLVPNTETVSWQLAPLPVGKSGGGLAVVGAF